MTVILTSVIATLVMVTLLTCTVMIVALVFCYRANISETTHTYTSMLLVFYRTSASCLTHTYLHMIHINPVTSFTYSTYLGLKRDTENRSSYHGNERLPPVYDEILPEKELAIELCNNEAYGHILH